MSITNEEMEKAHEAFENNVVPINTHLRLAHSSGGTTGGDWLYSLPQDWIFLARPRPDRTRLDIPASRLTMFEIVWKDPVHPLVLLEALGQEMWVWSPDFSQEFELKLARPGDGTTNTDNDGGV
jgi:hypothetical protein